MLGGSQLTVDVPVPSLLVVPYELLNVAFKGVAVLDGRYRPGLMMTLPEPVSINKLNLVESPTFTSANQKP